MAATFAFVAIFIANKALEEIAIILPERLRRRRGRKGLGQEYEICC